MLLAAIGGIQSQKRVSASHLIFNMATALVAFICLQPLIWLVSRFLDPAINGIMALALFHTLFNVLGALLFLPFIGMLSRLLVRTFPERKEILTIYLSNTPTEVPDAATTALRQEILHLLEECQLYTLRAMGIDERLVFDQVLPFEKKALKRLLLDDLYDTVKLLHGEIFEFYARLLAEKLDEKESRELERLIFASRNIMNAIKNIKGIRHNLEEFDAADNAFLNSQYRWFRRRLMELYHDINRIRQLGGSECYRELLRSFVHLEQADKRFIKENMATAASGTMKELDIASLLMVNRLFNQACRLQIFAIKDLLLSDTQIHDFDHALETKEFLDEEQARETETE